MYLKNIGSFQSKSEVLLSVSVVIKGFVSNTAFVTN